MFSIPCGDALIALDVPIFATTALGLVTAFRHTTEFSAGLAVFLSPHGSVRQT
jgi:hypothetical protein